MYKRQIKIIFDKYVNEHTGIFDIARYLNLCGFKTSHNKPFERRSIEYILQNPTYCGMIRWNRTVSETNEIRPESEWIVSDGQQPAIISKELFDKAQIRYKSEYKPSGTRPSSTYKHWLSGLMKCPVCGRTMIAKTVNNQKSYCYFTCYGYSKGKCLAKTSVSSLRLEPAVLASIKEVLDTGNIIYRHVEPVQETSVDLNVIITEQLRKNAEKFDRIREAYRNGVDTLDEYKENKRMVQEEKEMLEKQLADIKPAEPTIDTSKIAMLEKVRNVYEIIESDSVDPVTKNEILKSVIEKIIYDRSKDELKVYYYYAPESQ